MLPRSRTANQEGSTNSINHAVLIRHKLLKRQEDRYMLNIAMALRHLGFYVTILTSDCNRKECLSGFEVVFSSILLMVC